MNRFKLVLAALCLAVSTVAAADLKAGQHYTVLDPAQPTDTKDKIEVTELFWYGCGHCFNLEPILQKWLKKLPKDVVFRRVPAVFPGKNGAPGGWAPGARIYYTLEAMNLLDKLHGEVFDAMHVDRINLQDEKTLRDWLGSKGVDTQKFFDTYASFAVQSKVMRSQQLTVAHKINGVPALVVDGRYLPASGAAGSYDDITVVVDQLIDKVRKERTKK